MTPPWPEDPMAAPPTETLDEEPTELEPEVEESKPKRGRPKKSE